MPASSPIWVQLIMARQAPWRITPPQRLFTVLDPTDASKSARGMAHALRTFRPPRFMFLPLLTSRAWDRWRLARTKRPSCGLGVAAEVAGILEEIRHMVAAIRKVRTLRHCGTASGNTPQANAGRRIRGCPRRPGAVAEAQGRSNASGNPGAAAERGSARNPAGLGPFPGQKSMLCYRGAPNTAVGSNSRESGQSTSTGVNDNTSPRRRSFSSRVLYFRKHKRQRSCSDRR